MKPLPWRILVVTDAGVDSGRPARVTAEGAGAWLAAIGAAAEVPKPGGGTLRLEPRDAAGFAPPALMTALGTDDAKVVDAALHAPAFQRLESLWRGLSLLAGQAGEAVEVWALSVPRKELAGRFRQSVFEPDRGGEPWTLVVLDFDFGPAGEDLATLQQLAEMAKVLQTVLVGHASAAFFGLRYFVQVTALPDLIGRLQTPAHSGWRTFQAGEPARWVALTINRWLQRPAYTGDGMGHMETVSESNPDSYLWGRGPWLVGGAVARSIREHGHALAIAGVQGGQFGGMAVRAFPTAANVTVPLATEATVSEMQLIELSRAAFTPLLAPLRATAVMIPTALTVFRLNPGKPTVEGTIAYQLAAGRLARFCERMLDERPGGGPEETAAYFRSALIEHLGALAGDKPEEAVTVEAREEKVGDRVRPLAAVKVKPQVTLEGKAVDFEFWLPME